MSTTHNRNASNGRELDSARHLLAALLCACWPPNPPFGGWTTDGASADSQGVLAEVDRSEVRAELDRVGASFRKAGASDYISVTLRWDGVRLTGPPGGHPSRVWLGPDWRALELLSTLPDSAGAQAVWRALGRG